jgi:hypothetical protein
MEIIWVFIMLGWNFMDFEGFEFRYFGRFGKKDWDSCESDQRESGLNGFRNECEVEKF